MTESTGSQGEYDVSGLLERADKILKDIDFKNLTYGQRVEYAHALIAIAQVQATVNVKIELEEIAHRLDSIFSVIQDLD